MKVRSPRRARLKRVTYTAVTAVIVLLLALLLPRVFNVVAATVLLPITSVNTWIQTSSDSFPVFVRDRSELLAEIQKLKNDLVIAGGEDVTLQRLRDENDRLRTLLGATPETRILAAVTARPNELPYDLLRIDQGSRDGIVVGAPVYIGEDRFVGLVSHVTGSYAFVELLTTPGFEATGFIAGPDVVVALEGVGGGVARVRVPQGVALQIGDLVHVPTVEPGVFGRISHIENRPTQPEQYGYISPDVPINSIHFVAVGTRPLAVPAVRDVESVINELLEDTLLMPEVHTITPTTSTTSATGSASSAL